MLALAVRAFRILLLERRNRCHTAMFFSRVVYSAERHGGFVDDQQDSGSEKGGRVRIILVAPYDAECAPPSNA